MIKYAAESIAKVTSAQPSTKRGSGHLVGIRKRVRMITAPMAACTNAWNQ
jgi:hypothetical protein